MPGYMFDSGTRSQMTFYGPADSEVQENADFWGVAFVAI